MPELEFYQFSCLDDNYGVLVHDPISGDTASIDAPDAKPVLDALESNNWNLTHILVTHHHWDHTQGVEELKSQYNCHVIGPADEADKIDMLDQNLTDGDSFTFGNDTVRIILTPGHTLGMINFHFTQSGVVFTGDTLFALGCGRIFEGDANMMWNSLSKLASLPGDTVVYCGHEYTLANAQFALGIDPTNEKLVERAKEIATLREQNKPTLPTTLAVELETNPFLRASDPIIRENLGMQSASDAQVFAEIRARKDKG